MKIDNTLLIVLKKVGNMDLNQFINKVNPHGKNNSAPPFNKHQRHFWESLQLFSVKDCLNDNCSILDYGCGGYGTLRHTLFNHYPNAKYYGLDVENEEIDNKGFNECKLLNNDSVYFGNINELEKVLPKVDAMVMGSVFTHLSLKKIVEILDKTLPHYKRGFELGFTAFIGSEFSFNGSHAYDNNPDTWSWTVLRFDWFEKYCEKNNLEISLHPYVYKTFNTLPNLEKINSQSFMTIKKKTKKMFDYIVCFYFGERRVVITNELLLSDKYFFVKKHLDFIKNNKSVLNDINNIILVINNSTDEDLKSVTKIKNKYSFSNKIIVIGRGNLNYSYGAWNDGLINQIESNTPSTHAFLCEDDYVPCNENFHRKFIEIFDTDTVYVCQLFENNHAAISNGFISYSIIKEFYNTTKQLFVLSNDTNYYSAEINQINFLNNFKNYKCVDICEKYYSKFLCAKENIKIYGNTNGEEIIKPIMND
jgi:hypothetical protein